jgi:hypothetical protein
VDGDRTRTRALVRGAPDLGRLGETLRSTP